MGTTSTRWCRRATHASSRRRRAVWSVPDERGCVWASTTRASRRRQHTRLTRCVARSSSARRRGQREAGADGRSSPERTAEAGVASAPARFICGACERPCAGVLLSSSRTLLALHHCRLASVPGLDPPLRTLFRATVSSQFCIPDAFGAAGSSRSSTPAAFGAAAAPQARLDPRSRTSTAPYPDAFIAA